MTQVEGPPLARYGRRALPFLLAPAILGVAVLAALWGRGGGGGGLTGGVESLAAAFATLLTDATVLVPVGFAFGAGMVSAVNPCGFALLPAYLGFYLAGGAGGSSRSMAGGLAQALLVGAVVTAGFVLLFGAVGLLIGAGVRALVDLFPWIALGVGVLLALAGSWMLAGGTLYTSLAERIGSRLGDPRSGTLRGYFLFGVSYGVASLSCTLPIFLAVVGSALAVGSVVAAAGQFVLYALGMGLVILALTLSMALFRGALVRWIRTALPYIQPASAVLLLLAGAFIVFYWLTVGGLLG